MATLVGKPAPKFKTAAIVKGAIKRDGTQLRYPMPRFRMTPQDAADVIAYLRTQ